MAAKKKASRGRPTMLTPEVQEEFCRRLSEGEPITRICRDEHMPSKSTLWRWYDEHPEFRELSYRALEMGTNAIAHDCLEIADDMTVDVQNRKLMIDTRMRLIGKWNRKIYGEKVEVDQRTTIETANDAELRAELARKLEANGLSLADLLGGKS